MQVQFGIGIPNVPGGVHVSSPYLSSLGSGGGRDERDDSVLLPSTPLSEGAACVDTDYMGPERKTPRPVGIRRGVRKRGDV